MLCTSAGLWSWYWLGGGEGGGENRVSLRKTHQSSCPPLSALMGGIQVYGSCSGGWGWQRGWGEAEQGLTIISSSCSPLLSALTGGCEAHVAGNGMGEAEQDHSLAFVLSPQG